jgi:hypothetical protein
MTDWLLHNMSQGKRMRWSTLPSDEHHIFEEAEVSEVCEMEQEAHEPEGTEKQLRIRMHYSVMHYFMLEDVELGLCRKRSIYKQVGSF